MKKKKYVGEPSKKRKPRNGEFSIKKKRSSTYVSRLFRDNLCSP